MTIQHGIKQSSGEVQPFLFDDDGNLLVSGSTGEGGGTSGGATETTVSNIDTNVSSLLTSTGDIITGITQTNTQLGSISNFVDGLETSLSTLNTAVNTLSGYVDGIETLLTDIKTNTASSGGGGGGSSYTEVYVPNDGSPGLSLTTPGTIYNSLSGVLNLSKATIWINCNGSDGTAVVNWTLRGKPLSSGTAANSTVDIASGSFTGGGQELVFHEGYLWKLELVATQTTAGRTASIYMGIRYA